MRDRERKQEEEEEDGERERVSARREKMEWLRAVGKNEGGYVVCLNRIGVF